METPKKITIDDVSYVREDSIPDSRIGDKRIIVGDNGWVFAGSCIDNDDGTVTITNAKNIRRWGTSKGLGELINGVLPETQLDHYGTVKTRPIVTIAILSGWD